MNPSTSNFSTGYVCNKCGSFVKLSGSFLITDFMKKASDEQLCTSCKYWIDLAANLKEHTYVIGKELINFKVPPDEFEKTKYLLLPSGPLAATFNFNYGVIPNHLRCLFTDSAIFIKAHTYQALTSRGDHECYRKGCLGREKCWWYRGPDGWNEIPDRIKEKENPENCPIYINKFNPKAMFRNKHNKQ